MLSVAAVKPGVAAPTAGALTKRVSSGSGGRPSGGVSSAASAREAGMGVNTPVAMTGAARMEAPHLAQRSSTVCAVLPQTGQAIGVVGIIP
jgi:hypothetical protein